MRIRRNGSGNPLAGVALGLWCAFTLACGRNPGNRNDDSASENPSSVVAEVTVTRVKQAEVSATITISGTVAALPNQDVRVSALVPGRIARMMAAEGDRVSAGRALAKIEDRPILDQIQQAEAVVAQAKANLENARLNHDRNENLFARGIAARKELEDARTQVSVNEAAVRQAEAAQALARLQLARTEIVSPLSGTVVKRFASVGEQVDGTAAQPLFEVANLEEVELFGNVPSLYLSKIHPGEVFRVSTQAFPDRNFTGRVVAISPAVDPSTSVGLVRIRLANGAGLLRLGMFLTAQVPLETHSNALVVPLQAVYRDEKSQPRVYRVVGDGAEAVPVKLGLEDSSQVELLSGVQAGDTVILTGGYGLGEHAKVRVKP